MSVVLRMGSLGRTRPLELRRCDANIVLIKVDLPSPVCPEETVNWERTKDGVEETVPTQMTLN